ncbi:MAG: hypothetical protein ACJ790_17130 [Myxococcaceae bacterium]
MQGRAWLLVHERPIFAQQQGSDGEEAMQLECGRLAPLVGGRGWLEKPTLGGPKISIEGWFFQPSPVSIATLGGANLQVKRPRWPCGERSTSDPHAGVQGVQGGEGGAMLRPLDEEQVKRAWRTVFTRKQVIETLKLSDTSIRKRLETHKYTADYPGVYVRVEGVQTFLTALVAGARWLAPDGIVSGVAAGWLHRFDGCDAPTVELTVPRNLRHRESSGVAIHSATELPQHHVTTVAGLRCMTPARTLVHLCELGAPRRQIVMAYEDNYRRGWREREDLKRCVDELGAGRDLSILEDLLSRRGGKARATESALEAIADDMLWRAGIRGERQVTLVHEPTGLYFRFDLAFLELKYGLEFDGGKHRLMRRFQRDRTIDRRLQIIGWADARFTWADVQNELAFVSEARELLRARRESLFGAPESWLPRKQLMLPL